jgi:hypothetical protein
MFDVQLFTPAASLYPCVLVFLGSCLLLTSYTSSPQTYRCSPRTYKCSPPQNPIYSALPVTRVLSTSVFSVNSAAKFKNDKTNPIQNSLTYYTERTNPKIAQKKQTQTNPLTQLWITLNER